MIDTINQPESPRVIFVSLNIYKMRGLPVDRFISRLPRRPSRRQGIIIFFRFCPFAVTGSFPRNRPSRMRLSAVLAEQCVSWLVAERRLNQNSALATIDTSGPAE